MPDLPAPTLGSFAARAGICDHLKVAAMGFFMKYGAGSE
jgi:hypothetical protein